MTVAMDVVRSKMPVSYERAKQALEKCSTIDECKDWTDKAAALAAYGRQAKDETLVRSAQHIKARALKRMGELIEQIKPKRGGRPRKETRGGAPPSLNMRKSAGEAAGISPDQMKQAQRIGRVPEEKFEKAFENGKPPTMAALARLGTTKRKIEREMDDPRAARFDNIIRSMKRAAPLAEKLNNELTSISLNVKKLGVMDLGGVGSLRLTFELAALDDGLKKLGSLGETFDVLKKSFGGNNGT